LVKPLHRISDILATTALPSDRLVRLEREIAGENLEQSHPIDPVAATTAALADPLEFPPLSAAVVPGDRVAIAVDESAPCVGQIVQGMIDTLCRARIDAESISVVARDAQTLDACSAALSSREGNGVSYVIHDPDDKNGLCLVGMTKRHGPLVVNRTIFDADVVLPVGCARLRGCGAYESLFPRFSDRTTIERLRTPSKLRSSAARAERTRETEEAGWLIGTTLVIEVVPGANETVAHVVAGDASAVSRRARKLCGEQWALRSSQRASLVIATLTGGTRSQNWSNVARALVSAARLVAEDGAVAICSNLDQPPGESLGRLLGSTDLAATERHLLHERAEDSWPAWLLARALQRGPVYFLSQLAEETVEELGLAPVSDLEELERLAGRHGSVAVLENAQHAVAKVDGE
jgi:nickel-dependent lactate racemase